MDAPTSILYEIERHCNNYFNPANDPNGIRNYPDAFLELAIRIYDYTQKVQPYDYTSENVAGLHSYSRAVTSDGVPARWQSVFARDLAIYKRANFI